MRCFNMQHREPLICIVIRTLFSQPFELMRFQAAKVSCWLAINEGTSYPNKVKEPTNKPLGVLAPIGLTFKHYGN